MLFHIDIGRMPFNLRQKLLLQLIVCVADGSEVCCSELLLAERSFL